MRANRRTGKEEKGRLNILAVLSGVIPAGASAMGDVSEANAIFDAAREANGKFEFMSNNEIVEYCHGLSDTQLNGMVSLVHGRYFENIVADETGGTLFESHTHANTDMILDGTEISIKSNDATADSITEFETISPKDLNMNDEALIGRTAEVMDGDIIDATDALISGTVGFGTMAMLQAAGRSLEEWESLDEYEKTKMRAAWLGTKATAGAAASTAKGTWSLLKLAGKGMKKAYETWDDTKYYGSDTRSRLEYLINKIDVTSDSETDGHAILAQKLKDLYESLTFSGSIITDEEKKAIEELAKTKAGDDEILYKALRDSMFVKLAGNKRAKETELEDKKSKAFKDMLSSADELLKSLNK